MKENLQVRSKFLRLLSIGVMLSFLCCSTSMMAQVAPAFASNATCNDGTDAAQDTYFVDVNLTDAGTATTNVNVMVGTELQTIAAAAIPTTLTFGPFTHSGSGTATQMVTVTDQEETASNTATVSEALCGYDTDNGLHASGPACNCIAAGTGFIVAQVAPGSFDAATTTMVYVLTDGAGAIVTSNNTGLFDALPDGAYQVHAFNVLTTDLATFNSDLAAVTSVIGFTSTACNAGCNSSANYTIDCALPVCNVPATLAACSGEDLQLTETGGEATSWSWTGPNGFTSTDQNPLLTSVTTGMTGDYIVTVGNGTCENTCTIAVTVSETPTVAASALKSACSDGGLIELMATASADVVLYTWTGPTAAATAAISDVNSIDPTVVTGDATAFAGNYTVVVTTADGCIATSTVAVTVVDCECGVPSIVCAGDDIIAIATAPAPSPKVQWFLLTNSTTGIIVDGNTTGVFPTTSLSAGDYQIHALNFDPIVPPTIITDVNDPTILNGSTVGAIDDGCINADLCTEYICYTVAGNPTCDAVATAETCDDANDGEIMVTGMGGTGDYSFGIALTSAPTAILNSGTGSGFAFAGLAPNLYTVIITDANGCTSTCEATVDAAPLLACTVDGSTNETCVDDNDGTITVTASGGTGTLMYNIGDGPVISGVFAGLSSGTYTVTITDDNGCIETCTPVVILEAQPITCDNTTVTDVMCNAGNDGAITVTASGGEGTLSYSLDGGTPQATGAFTDLTVGSYIVTVEDENGCTIDCPAVVEEPAALTCTTAVVDVMCDGTMDGEVTVTPDGGTAPYTYSLDGGAFQPENTFAMQNPGTFTITVRDNNLCESTCTAIVSEPNGITCATVTTPTCIGATDGVITITAGGGTGAYTYDVEDAAMATVGNTAVVTGLAAGTYDITITDSVSGCTTVCSATIAEDAVPTVAASVLKEVCSGDPINLLATSSGGVTYAWTGPNGFMSTQMDPDVATVTGDAATYAGTYTVVITDASGCTATSSILVNVVNCACTPVTVCAGDDIIAIATAPAPAPKEQWFLLVNSNTGLIVDGNTTGVFPTAALAFGNYQIHALNFDPTDTPTAITNATDPTSLNGSSLGVIQDGCFNADLCIEYVCYTLAENPMCTLAAVNESCNGTDMGSITINITGGLAPYDYSVLDGASAPVASGTGNGQMVSNLAPDTYTVNITDANGCMSTCQTTLVAGPVISCTIPTFTNVTCDGADDGTITVVGMDGTGTLMFDIGDGNGASTTSTFPGLAAGTYTVTVSDDNGCTSTCTQEIMDAQPITCDATMITNVMCNAGNDGAITVTASGGTGTLSYSLDGGTAQATGVFTALTAGNYVVTVEDVNGCTIQCPAIVTEPAVLACSTTIMDAMCDGTMDGTITINATGGTIDYMYSLDGAAFQMSNMYSGLNPGSYVITVRDNNMCESTCTAIVAEPTGLTCNAVGTETCAGATDGMITITAGGGSGTYTYDVEDAAMATVGNTAVVTGLAGGIYDITITDTNSGCTTICSAEVTENPLPIVEASVVKEVCSGKPINLMAVTTGPVVSYAWTGPNGFTSGAMDPSVATVMGDAATYAGTYTVMVTDGSGCTATSDIAVTVVDCACVPAIVCAGDDLIAIAVAPAPAPKVQWFLLVNSTTGLIADGNTTGIFATMPLGLGDYQIHALNFDPIDAPTGVPNVADPTSLNGSTLAIIDDGCFNADLCTEYVCYTVVENPTCDAVATAETCDGADDGMIDVTGMGGTGDYSFDIALTSAPAAVLSSGTGSGFAFAGLADGAYTVTVTDVNGCMSTCEATILPAAVITCNITAFTDVTCAGEDDGTISVEGIGGTGPYTFDIGTGASVVSDFTALAAGVYTVTVTDVNGCTSTCEQEVMDAQPIVCGVPTLVNPTCNGDSDGSISVVATGGTTPLEYSINGVDYQATGDFTSLVANTYTVTVRDANLCTTTCTFDLVDPAIVACTITVMDALCGADMSASIEVMATGGDLSYTYDIVGDALAAQTSNMFTGLTAGVYTVIVSDGNSCTSQCIATIAEPTPIVCTLDQMTDVTCNGANDGSFTVVATGGTAPYQYDIAAGTNTTGIFTDLIPGTYTVTITDANNCSTVCNSITIAEPALLTCSNAGTTVSCSDGTDGTITVTAAGGTPVYMYSLDGGPFQASNVFMDLAVGTYTVTTMDANNCTTTCDITLTGNSALSCSTIPTNASCFGTNTGSVRVFGAGGTPDYMFSLNGGPFQISPVFSPLAAGTYTITVQDALGCTSTCDFVIGEPADLACSTTVADVTCANGTDGTITVDVTGGTIPYNYSIDNGVNYSTSNTFAGLPAGAYTVMILDDNDCETTCTATIVEGGVIACSVDAQSDVTCNGDADGSLTVSATGGTAPYLYDIGTSSNGTGVFNNLVAGTYDVSITDANLCTVECATVTIIEPVALTCAIINTSDITCAGAMDGSIEAQGMGGTGPYMFSVDGVAFNTMNEFNNLTAGNYTITVQDASGCTSVCTTMVNDVQPIVCGVPVIVNVMCAGDNNGSITYTATGGTAPLMYSINGVDFMATGAFTGLTADNYTVTVQDANGCMTQCPAVVTEPILLSCATASTDVTCEGLTDGEVTVTITGGTPPFTFSDDNGLTSQSSNMFTGLAAGNYDYLVTDDNGCTTTCSAIVIEPAAVVCMTVPTDVLCFGGNDGSFEVTATGGTPDYTFAVANSAAMNVFNGTGTTGSGSIIAGLTADTYTVVVTDANGCTSTCEAEINEPTELTCTTTVTAASCDVGNDGVITVAAVGGTPNYLYSIDGGTTTQVATTFTALIPGNYTVTTIDANGCISTCTALISAPGSLSCSVAATDITCNGAADGTLTVTATAGTAPYSYSLDGAPSQPANIFAGLGAGTYIVTTTDANGCMTTCMATIVEPSAVACSITPTDATCADVNDGVLTVMASGGAAGYTYSLDGAAPVASNVFTGLMAGNYTVTTIDADGCTAICMATINAPALLTCIMDAVDASCMGDNMGSVTINGTGGTGVYTYSVENSANMVVSSGINNVVMNLVADTYSATITDANGCTSVCSATILDGGTVTCNIVASTNVTCEGADDGSFTVAGMDGMGTYMFDIGTGASVNSTFTGLAAGTYTVTVTDENGCQSTCSQTIIDALPILCATNPTDVTCNAGTNGSVIVTASGGTGTLTYSIDGANFQASNMFAGLNANAYTITIMDDNNCTQTCTFDINEPTAITCSTAVTDIVCEGETNGMITVTATGGNPTYMYSLDGAAPQVSNVFTGLGAGNYSIQVTDMSGCISSTCTATIVEPTIVACSTVPASTSCFGGDDGTITITATGGTPVYTYMVENAGGMTVYNDVTNVATGLMAGDYTIIVTDMNGCSSSCTATVAEPIEVTCTLTLADASCGGVDDGTLTTTGMGGTGPYTYSLEGGPFGTSNVFTGLAPGTYTVTTMDFNGCTNTCMATITAPTVVMCMVDATDVTCNGGNDGELTITPSGGAGGYSYMVANSLAASVYSGSGAVIAGLTADTYTVTVTDMNGCTSTCEGTITEPDALTCTTATTSAGCIGGGAGSITVTPTGGTAAYMYSLNGAPAQTSNMFTGLMAGTYTIDVVDVNGCTSSCQATVMGLADFTCDLTPTNVTCNGMSDGQIMISTTGGLAPFSYSLDGINFQTASDTYIDLVGSVAGTPYTVTVQDANGCMTTCTTTIFEPTALTCDLMQATDVSCFGATDGTIVATGTGGTAPYMYAIPTVNSGAFQTVGLFTGLAQGTYTVNIQDALGCTTQCMMTVGTPLPITCGNGFVSMDVSCFGAADGEITVGAPSNGTAPYTYALNGGTFQSSNVFGSLTAGMYAITVRDANGCEMTCNTVTLGEPAQLTCTVVEDTPVTCIGLADGSATVTPVGGTVPYTYLWDNGETTATATMLTVGVHMVDVIDANGCTTTCNVTITELPALMIACPVAVALPACATATEIQTAYTAWVAGFTITDGVNPMDNTASIPTLPAFACGEAVSLAFTLSVTDDCNVTPVTCMSTFDVAPATPIALTCPTPVALDACTFEADIQTAYDVWVAGFTVGNGCNTTSNIANIPALPAFTCGGAVSLSFTLNATGDCGTDSCTSTFDVAAGTPLAIACPTDEMLPSCSIEADVLAAYNTWAAGFTVTDGCNTASNVLDVPALPTFVCGEAVSLSFTLSATDDCNPIPLTCTSTFNVAAGTPLAIACPTDEMLPSCSTEADVLAAYNAWVAGFTVNGGCGVVTENTADIPVLPAFACGEAVSLTFTLSTTDDCNTIPLTCTSTFNVAAEADLAIACPAAEALTSCATAADIQTAYDAWVAGFTVTGGCNTVSNVLAVPALPAFMCGEAVSLTFTLSATDDCNATPLTCTSTFDVAAEADLAIACPTAEALADCSTEADVMAAYNAWVAGFTVTGGCNTVSNVLDVPALPAFVCGEAVSLTFTLSATDDCNATPLTCTSTFDVAAGTPLAIVCPANELLPSCSTEADIQTAYNAWVAGFTVANGCGNVVDNLAAIPALPAFTCGGSVNLSFTLSVTDDCNVTPIECTSTFDVDNGQGLVVSCPTPVALPACTTAADIQTAYDAWVADFMVNDGCNTVSNIANIPALPAFDCGEPVNLTFTLSATDDCNPAALECTSTFNVADALPLAVNCPAPVVFDACVTQTDLQTAYDAWVAGFTVINGCNANSNIATIPALPALVCGVGIDLNFTLSATDDCNTTPLTCNSTFVVESNPTAPLTTNGFHCAQKEFGTQLLTAKCQEICAGVTSTTTWWDAPTGGNMIGTGDTFDPATTAGFDATVPGCYNFYAQCDYDNGCVSFRTAATFQVIDCEVECEEGCMYFLVMEDAANDGWDAASINVSINEAWPATNYKLTATGCNSGYQVIPMIVNDGGTIDVAYTHGAFENDHAWQLLDWSMTPVLSTGYDAMDCNTTSPSIAVGGTERVKADCPACCVEETNFIVRITTGDFAEEHSWEIYTGPASTTAQGDQVIGVNATTYTGLAPGTQLTYDIALDKCETYTFVAFDGFNDSWNGGSWELITTDLNYGNEITNLNDPLYGNSVVMTGPNDPNFTDEDRLDFTIPCQNCYDQDAITFTGADPNNDCLWSDVITGAANEPFVCYPNCNHALPNGCLGEELIILEHGNPANAIVIPGPFTYVNGVADVDLAALGLDVEVGCHKLIQSTTYCDGVIAKCTTDLNIVSDINPTLVCNDLVNISLGAPIWDTDVNNNGNTYIDDLGECVIRVTPDMVLEMPNFCEGEYTVTILDASGQPLTVYDANGLPLDNFGNPIPNGNQSIEIAHDFVSAEQVGQTLTYVVEHKFSENACWGELTVEDKLAPVIVCNDYDVACNHPEALNEDWTQTNVYEPVMELPANIAGGTGGTVSNTFIPVNMPCGALGEVVQSIQVALDLTHNDVTDLQVILHAPTATGLAPMLLANNNQVGATNTWNNTAAMAALRGMPCGNTESTSPEDFITENSGNNVPANIGGTWYIQVVDNNATFPTPPYGGGEVTAASITLTCGFPSSVFAYDCTLESVELIDEQIVETNCDQSDWNGAQIIRVWQAIDAYGNSSTCEQTVNLKAPMFSEIVFPADQNIECSSDIDLSIDANGVPGYDCFPIDTTQHGLCDIVYLYEDQEFETCGNAKKIFRTWTVMNCCNLTVKTHTQLIKIEDTEGPVINVDDIVANTGVYECTANLQFNEAITDGCSDVISIIVSFYEGGGAYNGNGNLIVTDVTNGGTISNLPVGVTEILVKAQDACYNVTEEVVSITIEDNTTPVAICDDNLHVSLGSDGTAWLAAEHIDEGSYDNCGEVTLEVRRTDGCLGTTPWSDNVPFECCDVDEYVTVELKVTDEAGNSNVCWKQVLVQDALAPTITCPANVTVDCNDSALADLSVFGEAVAEGNCSVEVSLEETDDRDQCQAGTIRRTWTATNGSQQVSCTQIITVVTVSDFIVQFPADVTISTCPDDLGATGEPTISDDDCELVAINHEDLVLTVVDDACYVIERTWTLINGCVYDQGNPANTDLGIPQPLPRTFQDDDGYFQYTQIIKVSDSNAPVITCPGDQIFDDLTDGCEGEAILTVEVEDGCSPAEALEFTYEIDVDNDGDFDIVETGNDATGVYPYGTHAIKWVVEDGCGNTSSCEYTFTIRDRKNPTPVCLNGISIENMQTGCVEIWASDLLEYAFDNCSSDAFVESTVKMRRLGDTAAPQGNMTLCCDEIGIVAVEIWVEDEAGNADYCTTYIDVQDNLNNCDQDDSKPTIAGHVETRFGEMVEMTEVELTGGMNEMDMTQSTGTYLFLDAPANQNYTITPEKDINPTNGVSTFDLVLMSQHILGVAELTNPYQLIAADVNNDGVVSTFDIVQNRQLILYVIQDFPSNTSWRFVPKAYVFPNPANPWTPAFPEVIDIENLQENRMEEDFIGIKIGDVDGSALPNSLIEADDRNMKGEVQFKVDNTVTEPGTSYRVDFRAGNFQDLMGYQFTMNFDQEVLEFASVEAGALAIGDNNFGFTMLDEGIITTSWNVSEAMSFRNDEVLFSMYFNVYEAAQLSEVLSFNSRYTVTEAYNDATELLDVTLAFVSEDTEVVTADQFELFQNKPNPFSGRTLIGFNLPQAATATLTVHDVAGKLLRVVEGDFDKGYNEVTIDSKDLKGTGVLYYQLDTPDHSATKKMILLD